MASVLTEKKTSLTKKENFSGKNLREEKTKGSVQNIPTELKDVHAEVT